jgi:hypothetical protein
VPRSERNGLRVLLYVCKIPISHLQHKFDPGAFTECCTAHTCMRRG